MIQIQPCFFQTLKSAQRMMRHFLVAGLRYGKSLAQSVETVLLLKSKQTITMTQCASNSSSCPYHVHKVTVCQESVKTAGQIIHFEVSVADTHPGDSDKPVVLGLHGSPGHALDFEPLIQMLSERNIRFVAPTFPGFDTNGVEPWKLFHLDYSTAGLVSIVEQILIQLRIDRVSMVMAHSAGAWVGLKMAAELDNVKSLCLISPGCGRPHKVMRPEFGVQGLAWLLRHSSLHFVLMPLVKWIYSFLGFKGIERDEPLMASQQILALQVFEDTRRYAKMIKEKQLPLLFVYTLNDRLIETPLTEEMVFQHLGMDKDSVIKIDKDRNQSPLTGTPVDPADTGKNTAWFAHVLQFERGGHLAHKAHSHIVLDHVLQLLAHVENSKL